MMSRERNSRPAMTNGSMGLSSADEVHDLDLIPFAESGAAVLVPLDHDEVALDRHAPRIDAELGEQVVNRQRVRDGERVSVQHDAHATINSITRGAASLSPVER